MRFYCFCPESHFHRAHSHFSLMQAFFTLRCILEEVTLFLACKVSSSKVQCIKRMHKWDVATRWYFEYLIRSENHTWESFAFNDSTHKRFRILQKTKLNGKKDYCLVKSRIDQISTILWYNNKNALFFASKSFFWNEWVID